MGSSSGLLGGGEHAEGAVGRAGIWLWHTAPDEMNDAWTKASTKAKGFGYTTYNEYKIVDVECNRVPTRIVVVGNRS